MRVCSSTPLASYTSFGFGCLLFDAMLPLLTLCCRFSLDLFAKRACRRNCFLQHALFCVKRIHLRRAYRSQTAHKVEGPKRRGREELSTLVTVVGLVIALFLVVDLVADLFSSLQSIFALY